MAETNWDIYWIYAFISSITKMIEILKCWKLSNLKKTIITTINRHQVLLKTSLITLGQGHLALLYKISKYLLNQRILYCTSTYIFGQLKWNITTFEIELFCQPKSKVNLTLFACKILLNVHYIKWKSKHFSLLTL